MVYSCNIVIWEFGAQCSYSTFAYATDVSSAKELPAAQVWFTTLALELQSTGPGRKVSAGPKELTLAIKVQRPGRP